MPFRRFSSFLFIFFLLFCVKMQFNCSIADKIVKWKIKYEKGEQTEIVGFAFLMKFKIENEGTENIRLTFSKNELDEKCKNCEFIVQNELSDEMVNSKTVQFQITMTTNEQKNDVSDGNAPNPPLIRFFEFVLHLPNFKRFYTINLQNVDHFGHLLKRVHFDVLKMPNKTNFVLLFVDGFGPRGNDEETEESDKNILVGYAPISPAGQQIIDVKMAVNFKKMVKKYAFTYKMQMAFFEFEYLAKNQLENEEECAICLTEFEGEEEKFVKIHQSERQQTKAHVFHEKCIFKWFERRRKCPYCGNEIKAKKEIILMPLLSSSAAVSSADQCQIACENAFACLTEMAEGEEKSRNVKFEKRQAKIALDEMIKYADNLNREAISLFDLKKEESAYGVRLIGMENGKIVLFNQQIPVKESLEQIVHNFSLQQLPEQMKESAAKLLAEITCADLHLQSLALQTVHAIQLMDECDESDEIGGK